MTGWPSKVKAASQRDYQNAETLPIMIEFVTNIIHEKDNIAIGRREIKQ